MKQQSSSFVMPGSAFPALHAARLRPSHRHGITLLELLVVLAVVGILAALAVPRVGALLDRARVSAATTEAVAVFGIARHLAIRQAQRATLAIDESSGSLFVRIGGRITHQRGLARSYGVSLEATQDSMTFHPTGIGYGAANLSLRIARGRAADTVVVSRLGRVRR